MAYDLYDETRGQGHDWVFAGLPLVTREGQEPQSGFWFVTYADGFDLGSAQALSVVRESLLLDGDDEVIDRFGNRTITWTTAVCGRTMADVIAGERVLAQRLMVPTTLVFTPPGSGAKTLFDVRTSWMDPVPNDLAWIAAGVKYQAYALTIKAGPWGYAETVTTETFASGSTVVTVVDNCAANTNWPGTTATTYLSQSAVRLGPVTASQSQSGWNFWSYGSTPHWDPVYSSNPAGGTLRFTGTVPAGNFMYLDLAVAMSGYTGTVIPPFLTGVGPPLASQLQADGYMRYFWARKAGPLSFEVAAVNLSAGDTATFYADEFGTATVLPSTSLFLLSTKGSVRVRAQLRVSHPSVGSSSLGKVMVYADPSMMTHGWQPDDDSTWVNAPDGSYWVWVQPDDYVAGDSFSIVIDDQLAVTQAEETVLSGATNPPWLPMGPFFFGGRRTRRLGAVSGLSDTLNLRKNGDLGWDAPTRLFREHDDASLIYVEPMPAGANGQVLFVDPPTLDQPLPGMFAGDASSLTSISLTKPTTFGGRPPLRSWGWPLLLPPLTALWVKSTATTTPNVAVVHRPPFHTFAAEN